jgi:hypothetical protein
MQVSDYTKNFPTALYDIDSPFSNLRMLIETFLDEVESVRSKILVQQIGQAIDQIQFYHLDKLFGDILRFPLG